MKKYVLLFTLIVSLLFVSCQTTMPNEAQRTITVQGKAVVYAEPDRATFSISVNELSETTKEAQQLANQKVQQILRVLQSFDIEEKRVKTSSLSITPEYRWVEESQVLVGQRVRQSLNVEVRNIKENSVLLSQLFDALGNINSISIGSISFDKEDTTKESQLSRTEAVEHATAVASDYARAFNLQLGKPIEVVESSNDYRIVPLMASVMKMDSSFSTEIPTGEIEITSSVSVVFELY
ncbi:MAG: SIMPL domain-containing protein [Sphaerochaetaceae bacterium]